MFGEEISPKPLDKAPSSGPSLPNRFRWRGGATDLDFSSETPAFRGGDQSGKAGYKVIAWSWAATLIDVLVVFAMVCIFMVAGQIHGPGRVILQAATVLGFFLHSSYLILLRVFLGNTLGEWACGLKVGKATQRFSVHYTRLVLLRFFVVLGTGVILLPLLSVITGSDWAGRFSGLPLVQFKKVAMKRA